MRTILTLAATAAMLALSACDRAITEPYGAFTGTWRYRATGFQYWPAHPGITCTLEATLRVRQEGNAVEGVQTEPAIFTCAYPDGRTSTHEQYGTIRGEIQDGRIHFSNAGGWHSFGELEPNRVEGYLESYGGVADQPAQTVRSGSFVMERISNDGYYGPPA